MGQKVPIPDDKMQKQIDLLKMEKKDLGKLWASFKRYDKDKSGAIDVDEFYKMLGEKRSLFGDSIFELIDIDDNNQLDFSEFMTRSIHVLYVWARRRQKVLFLHI